MPDRIISLDSNDRRDGGPTHLLGHGTVLHDALKAMSPCSKGNYSRINEQNNLTFNGAPRTLSIGGFI